MRCEYCNKILRRQEAVHAVTFGCVDVVKQTYIPAKESAPSIMCSGCGELLLKMLYIRLETKTLG